MVTFEFLAAINHLLKPWMCLSIGRHNSNFIGGEQIMIYSEGIEFISLVNGKELHPYGYEWELLELTESEPTIFFAEEDVIDFLRIRLDKPV